MKTRIIQTDYDQVDHQKYNYFWMYHTPHYYHGAEYHRKLCGEKSYKIESETPLILPIPIK